MPIICKKAGLTACLFLWLSVAGGAASARRDHPGDDDQWRFGVPASQGYDMLFNLDLAGVHQLIPEPETVDEIYVVSLAECLELLLEEDGRKYTEYEEAFERRRERKTKPGSPAEIFLQAEISIQWAFVYFKFGHEFDAALSLRDAYTITSQARKRYPGYKALYKTAAFLEVIVGSVPEKYNWVLALLGIEGSVDTGLQLFEDLHLSSTPLKRESDMLHAMVRCYVLQQTAEASTLFEQVMRDHPSSIGNFLAASVAIKNAETNKALQLLLPLDTLSYFQVDYASYLLGEVYLCKAEYLNSITAYRKFLQHYKGQNNIKDATYKIGLCYWLNGNVSDALESFRAARNVGREVTEADKYAARSLAEDELPHPKLAQARYFTDGGYYAEAKQTLEQLPATELKTPRDEIEFYYRRARLNHKTNRLDTAKTDYRRVIAVNGDGNWYFAPNACLQLGYIFVYEKDTQQARECFERALSYKKHEYKNSIDTKARSALGQLKRR